MIDFKGSCLLTCRLFFAKILIPDVNDNGNVSGNVSGNISKVKIVLNTLLISQTRDKAYTTPALLEMRSLFMALHPKSILNNGGEEYTILENVLLNSN
jgi:hypothetical protein